VEFQFRPDIWPELESDFSGREWLVASARHSAIRASNGRFHLQLPQRAASNLSKKHKMKPRTILLLAFFFLPVAAVVARTQTVSPIITEYKEKGEGKITLVNNTLSPLVVTLQPQSFSINPDGSAKYRPLDPGIHVDLSITSVKLQPTQEYYVFYKARADTLPAWFTVYATFSAPQHGPGLNLRIMLPHTVYLFQKEPLQKDGIKVGEATYDPAKKLVACDLENISTAYGRMREGSVDAGRDSAPVGGFPMLPGSPRHLEVEWTGKGVPESMVLHFDKFEIRLPVNLQPPAESR
jgi:hypothetical protein